ncbi:MAG: aminodeoxychorismate synthase component I [Paracoccaceae bacterium]
MTDAFFLAECGPSREPALFQAPRAIIRADSASEVAGALDALDAALASGRWVAGLAAYELGYALEPKLAALMPAHRSVPLLAFGVFDAPEDGTATLALARDESTGAALSDPVPLWSRADHAAATARVLDLIAAGDIYQANLTFPLTARWSGTPLGLFARLGARQPVPHGALLCFPGIPAILSRSPELFFATGADGTIETRPMKGTAPRSRDPAEDARLRDSLAASAKDRAENLMIVDLLRNDIARVTEAGSVRVPDLFGIETYATVHQMVSRVTGSLRHGTRLSDIFRALFPCGSVTGAPKIRAMEVIRSLEPLPRGAYCGALGWAGPDGRSSFNVAIRTLTLHDDGRADLGVGGGIVADSTPGGEYEEALWKARFARPAQG